ncbi:MAG TPA: PIN domain-containing protein [Conexibacter sp.]|nr:PIN domain-containing protein [Conexibacter sp.]
MVDLGLADTSVVIGLGRREIARDDLDDQPAELAVSALTVAGLHHGVLVASPDQLALRLRTLRFVENGCVVLPIDTNVAVHYGRIAADARRLRGRRIALGDGLIAATAAAHGLPLYTRDGDFEDLPGVTVVQI